MSETYIVDSGDTIESLAVTYYGLEEYKDIIIMANPILASNTKLYEGEEIILPSKQDALQFIRNELGIDGDGKGVVIYTSGIALQNVSKFQLEKSIDEVADTFSFEIPWDVDDPVQREMFKPFKFNDVSIFIDEVRMLTGVIVDTDPVISGNERKLKLEGYSYTGYLNDCHQPRYPLTYKKITLANLCRLAVESFQIKVVDDVQDTFVFDELECKPTEIVYKFLMEQAKKRGCLLGNDEFGNFHIKRATTEPATISIKQGSLFVVDVQPEYNGQAAFNRFVGISKGDSFAEGEVTNVVNALLVQTKRPRVTMVEVSDVKDADELYNATNAAMRRTVADSVSYKVVVSGWKNTDGEFWKDNTRINFFYPDAFVLNEIELLIRAVKFTQKDKSEVTELTLVLPGAYSLDEKMVTPWE